MTLWRTVDAYRSWNAGGRGGRSDSRLDGELGAFGRAPEPCGEALRRLAGGADGALSSSLSECDDVDEEEE